MKDKQCEKCDNTNPNLCTGVTAYWPWGATPVPWCTCECHKTDEVARELADECLTESADAA